jgi:GTP pyrophosphokinase
MTQQEGRVREGTCKEDHESFMRRFRLKVRPKDIEKIDYAYDMAKYGHRNQFRESGARYFEHVRATAIILIDELGITDIEIIISALLHDMLEDSFLLTPERIKITFGDRVSMLVNMVSKPKKSDKRFTSDVERHRWYFEQVANSCVEAKLLKLADRLQNMRTLSSCSLEKQRRKIRETEEIYLPLIEDISKEYPEKASYLSNQMQSILDKLSQILDSNQSQV